MTGIFAGFSEILDSLHPFEWVWSAFWQATILFAVVTMIILIFGKHVAPRWQFVLWSLVLLRLALPVVPHSSLSIFNLLSPLYSNDLGTDALEFKQTSGEFALTAHDGKVVGPQTALGELVELESIKSVAIVDATPTIQSSVSSVEKEQGAIPILLWLAIIWICGFTFCIFRSYRALSLVRRLKKTSCLVTDPIVLERLAFACDRVGLRSQPQLKVLPHSASPFVAGVWRPEIFVSEYSLESLSKSELVNLFAHESAHIRRRDVLIQWLSFAISSVYWFHPVAAMAFRQMIICRELACDDLASSCLNNSGKRKYARMLLRLAISDGNFLNAPGLCGMFTRRRPLAVRIRRLIHGKPEKGASKMAFALVLLTGVIGLTDAVAQPERLESNNLTAHQSNDDEVDDQQNADFVIRGSCKIGTNNEVGVEVTVTLYSFRGLSYKLTKLQETRANQTGEYVFEAVAAPAGNRFSRLKYVVTFQADGYAPREGVIEDRITMVSHGNVILEEGLGRVVGRVVDEQGDFINGATVERYREIPGGSIGFPAAITQKNGLFQLKGIPLYEPEVAEPKRLFLKVRHPDYPTVGLHAFNNESARLVLPTGARIEGQVLDATSKKPLANLMVSAIPNGAMPGFRETYATTDADGRYKFVVLEGAYKITVEDESLVTAAQILDCRKGVTVNAPPLLATPGGWIVGRTYNELTGEPKVWAENFRGMRERIQLGCYGPSRPTGRQLLISHNLAEVDDEGRFRMRVFPGENFPYLINIWGSRNATSTLDQPAVMVLAGEETRCDFSFVTDEQKVDSARQLLDSMPDDTEGRVDAIIAEFRKLNHTVDECELWCLLMQELVTIGRPAVPALCRELDSTDEERMLRRLGFALRAIGDPRAVPALIRALPKTLLPSSSDYGLRVNDVGLTRFMVKHQIPSDRSGSMFSFGRPVREIYSALFQITKYGDGDSRHLSDLMRRVDRRARAKQEEIYHAEAKRWADWWEANWKDFDVEESWAKVDLPAYTAPDVSKLPTGMTVINNSQLESGMSKMVLTPIGDADTTTASFFLDLDLGARASWPPDLPPLDASNENIEKAKKWAAGQGIDLLCVERVNEDGSVSYALSGVGLQAWEISKNDREELEGFLKEGKLPQGLKLDSDLLLHRDEETQSDISATETHFLFLTREQGIGVLTITDFVTTARDITGSPFTEPGVGFHRGVRFDYRLIAR